jgi:hypothetical protein
MTDLIAEMALEAERKIQTRRWLDEIKPPVPITLTVSNYRAVLPKDYYDCDEIEYCAMQGVCSCGASPCTCSCDCGISSANAIGSSCGCGAWSYGAWGYYMGRRPDFRIEGCYIMAPFRTGAVQINYFAIPLDEAGYPEIMESHRDAIRAYCLWELNRSNWLTGKISDVKYKILEDRWKDLCVQARGMDNMPTRREMATAAAVSNDPWKFKKVPGRYYGGWASWWV